MSAAAYGWIALTAPLVAVAFNLTLGAGFSRKTVGWVASLAMLVGFAASLGALWQVHDEDGSRQHVSTAWTWLTAGDFRVDFTILVDPLSIVMLLVVTGVGFLIHAYSVGYMHGDAEERRFFAYLNFFAFAMLLLVLAGNFLFLLIGWGLVGLASYFLIGFWWDRPSAIAAAKKAFIMNAIGDVGMAIALFVIFTNTGTLDYIAVFAQAPEIGVGTSTMNWIAILLLVGAVAKSAQIPLQTWLPDAMEGPTPVSALIHAATMVTAGVYLIARMWPIYERAPDIAALVAVVGAATLTLAGLIALVQTDIKRVIAYSTMSQIGYMFCGVGIGAYASGMFHLVAHAFFKALLFLGAGVVIHALHDEQDMRRMGGLKRYLPYTTVVMWIGALALLGVPPLAGFFSKDAILAHALADGGWVGYLVWSLGLAGTFVTAIYTCRMMFLVFHGPESEYAARTAPAHTSHGEGPFSMLWTIGVLALGTILVGFLAVPHAINSFADFVQYSVVEPVAEPTGQEDTLTSLLAVGLALGGLVTAYALWAHRSPKPRLIAEVTQPAERVFQERFGFDLLYERLIAAPTAALATTGTRLWEGPVIGGVLGLAAGVLGWSARVLAYAQSGLVRTYALFFALGVVALGAWFLTGAAS